MYSWCISMSPVADSALCSMAVPERPLETMKKGWVFWLIGHTR
jgi:hypothetical protein